MPHHTLVPRLCHYTLGPPEPAFRARNCDTATTETRDYRGYDSKGDRVFDSLLLITEDARNR
jgi:hypothetical protein